jgi:Ca-activated chloride channel family protein
LFVFREDYLAKFDRLFYLCPELPDHFLRLTPPTPESIHQILRGPFTTETLPQACWDHEISPALANDLAEKLVPGGGRATINLAQVQIVALQLWLSVAPDEALSKRGVGGLVEDYQEGALAPLGRDKQLAESLLTFMITREGTRKVLLETEAIEHAKRKERVGEDTVRLVLNRLVNETRLVRRDFNRNAASYEIVSEFLVPWIRRLKLQREAKDARNRLLRRSALILVVVFLTLVGVFSWKYYRTNKEQAVLDAKNETKKALEIAAETTREYSAEHDARLAAEARERETLTILQSSKDDQVHKLSGELASLQQSSDSAQIEIAGLKQKNGDQEKKLQEISKTVDEQLKTIDEQRKTINQSKTEAINAKTKMAEFESDLKKLKDENQKLRDELETFKKQVVVAVSLLDDWNRMATGFEHQDFRVFEDNIEQRIVGFSVEDMPRSVAIVLDMGNHPEPFLTGTRSAVVEFLKTLNEKTDEVMLITCGEQARVSLPFTKVQNYEAIQTTLSKVKPERRTALVDGIYLALNELKKGTNSRKTVVIFSKEWNNSSRHRIAEIDEAAKRSEARIYSIVINTTIASIRDFPGPSAMQEMLARIGEQTGGGAYEVNEPMELSDLTTKIGFQLENLYVLRYQPTNERRDGRFRRIEVRFAPKSSPAPPGFRPHLYYRRGYYSPLPQ